jgi:hypothetical protein
MQLHAMEKVSFFFSCLMVRDQCWMVGGIPIHSHFADKGSFDLDSNMTFWQQPPPHTLVEL